MYLFQDDTIFQDSAHNGFLAQKCKCRNLGEHECLVGTHSPKLSIKLGRKPTIGIISETKVIV